MHRRPILMKFFLIFTVTIVVSSVLSGVLMSGLVQRYMLNSKEDDIVRTIDALDDLWIAYINSERNAKDSNGAWISSELKSTYENDYNNLRNTIEQYEAFLGDEAYIYLVEPNGAIAFSYPLLPNSDRYSAGRKLLPENIISRLLLHKDQYYFPKSEQYVKTLQQTAPLREETDFYGLYGDRDVKYLTVTQSVYYLHPELKTNTTAGLIAVSVPIPNVVAARNTVVGYFIVSTILAVLLELVILIYFTKKLTDPLRELQAAASRVADGAFDQKILKRSNDEIGALVESFNQMEDSLANLDQMRNDFIANVSHELRTPMTSIGGFIDAILEGVVPPEKQTHYLNIIRREITRLNTLVNDLLDVARLQSGYTKLDLRREDVNRIATDCVSKLEPIIREKGLETVLDFKTPESFAWVDVASLERVFINLIQNAVKFTNSGGIITIHTGEIRGVVQVIVEDTGAGISPEDQKMIFERFYKADRSRGLDKKGTGLGLSLVKNILAAHGGSIRVESELGVGSKFIFTLPQEEPKQNRNEEECDE